MADVDEYEPPLFDQPRQTRTPPTPEVEDEAGRPLRPCRCVGPKSSWTEPSDQRDRVAPPKCNRTHGHEGPHQRINPRSFGIEASWT